MQNIGRTIISLIMVLCVLAVHARDYEMAGPYEIIARDGEHRRSKAGSERDMKLALDYATEGDTAQALKIINAYTRTLKRLDGHDAPLCLIQCFDLVRAMIALEDKRQPEWEEMIRKAMLPTMDSFESASPYANGNWGAIVNRARMACAIFLNDDQLYKAATDYFMYAFDNGSLPRYISETGQCQETGRDQGHVQLGLEALCQTCDMAWRYRGDDLWSAYDNRLLKGIEYTAKYNLGYDVPFVTWEDCTGLYNEWTVPSEMSRGKLWNIYHLPYNHYHDIKGLPMPYTAKAIKVLSNNKLKARYEKLGRKMVHRVMTYAAPQGAPLKHDYEISVRPRDSKEWTSIDTYMAKVNASVGNGSHRVSEISYAQFDFVGNVFVKVTTKGRKFKTARIRPDYKGVITNIENDSTIQFTLFQPENLSIEFDGDIAHNLLLFTSRPPLQVEEARKGAEAQKRTFVYYAPGIYRQDSIVAESNTTYYLAGGSYFTGTFALNNVENVSILGRGIARPPRGFEGVHVYNSRNVKVDGMIVNTCPIGGSTDVIIHDVRSISHPSWGDGMNIFASSNVTFDRVFCRNSDDCTTVYATRKGFVGSSSNITMKNSTLWADVAHPIFIGLHGNAVLSDRLAENPEAGDSCTNLRYSNIDILGQCEPQIDYQGCLAINCGDNNLVRDVTFDNIRIEEIERGSMVNMRICNNEKYCKAPGRGISNVTFSNIRYNGKEPELSIITGFDQERTVSNIVFDNLRINGRHIHDKMKGKPGWYKTSDLMRCFVGNHVNKIIFR